MTDHETIADLKADPDYMMVRNQAIAASRRVAELEATVVALVRVVDEWHRYLRDSVGEARSLADSALKLSANRASTKKTIDFGDGRKATVTEEEIGT